MYVGRVPMHDDQLVEQEGAAEVAGGGAGLEESGEEAGIAEHQWGGEEARRVLFAVAGVGKGVSSPATATAGGAGLMEVGGVGSGWEGIRLF